MCRRRAHPASSSTAPLPWGTPGAASVYRAVGIPIVEGLAALRRGAYVEAIELLVPVRFDLWRIGGGRAQRDVVDWTLTGAAVRNALNVHR